jgi:hypothetical protein
MLEGIKDQGCVPVHVAYPDLRNITIVDWLCGLNTIQLTKAIHCFNIGE